MLGQLGFAALAWGSVALVLVVFSYVAYTVAIGWTEGQSGGQNDTEK